MLSAEIIKLFTHRYEFMNTFQELGEISNTKRQPEEYIFAFQNHVLDGVAFTKAVLTSVFSCIERLPRFLRLVFYLSVYTAFFITVHPFGKVVIPKKSFLIHNLRDKIDRRSLRRRSHFLHNI